jgi:hypothetical protein
VNSQNFRAAATLRRVSARCASRSLPYFLAAGVCITSTKAGAIRPFVTDDARVVGDRLAQLETWLLLDRLALEHNLLAALGPTEWLEVTLGMVHGGLHSGLERAYSLTGPIVQAKALLLSAESNGRPGVAIAAGTLPPGGFGPFKADGWGAFGYLALTESLFEESLLIHANLGFAIGYEFLSEVERNRGEKHRLDTLVTTGLGVQVRLVAGLHGVAEVYYGDPYDSRASYPAMQTGLRYIFGDHVQMDGTFGTTLASIDSPDGREQLEHWGSLGVRLVSHELW